MNEFELSLAAAMDEALSQEVVGRLMYEPDVKVEAIWSDFNRARGVDFASYDVTLEYVRRMKDFTRRLLCSPDLNDGFVVGLLGRDLYRLERFLDLANTPVREQPGFLYRAADYDEFDAEAYREYAWRENDLALAEDWGWPTLNLPVFRVDKDIDHIESSFDL